MSRARVNQNPPQELFDTLGSLEVPVELKLQILATAREESADAGRRIDEALLVDNARLRTALHDAEQTLAKLAATIEKLTAPPLLPAIVLARDCATVFVAQGASRRVVHIGEDFEGDELQCGEEVLLASGANVILGRSPYRAFSGGETAAFDRYLGNRLILKSRDEEIVADPVGDAATAEWKPGDLARWERALYVVTERIPRSEGGRLWLEETPRETFDDIGGLDAQIEVIRNALGLGFERSDIGLKYCVGRVACILLYGPPGTGKTLLARAIANWLARLAGNRKSHFMHIRPGEFLSMWVGESERKLRECFRVAREAADRDPDLPVVIFLDEVDAVASRRGRSATAVDDRVVCALAEELSGFTERPNLCVIGATNRLDVLDPALTRPGGRFGDLCVAIPRPNRDAAREILLRHMPATLPCAVPGFAGDDARGALVDTVLSMIYAPNAVGEIARLTLRDGSVRSVQPRELVSGAALAKIVRSGIERAALRDAAGGGEGVRCEDLLVATEAEIERSVTLLTASNAQAYLQDLPEDLDVMSVTPVRKKARKAHRYLRIA